MDQLEIFTVQSDDETTHQCILGHFASEGDSGRTPPPEQKPTEWVRVTASSKRHQVLGYLFGRNTEASIVLPAMGGVSGKQFSIKPTPRGIEIVHWGSWRTRYIVIGTEDVVKLETPGDKRSILDGQKVKILDPVSLDIKVSTHSAEEQQLKERFCALLAGEVTTLDNLDLASASSTLPPRDDDQGLNHTRSGSKRNIQGSEDTDLIGPRGSKIRRHRATRTSSLIQPSVYPFPGHQRIARNAQRGSPASRGTSGSTSRSISRPHRVRFVDGDPSVGSNPAQNTTANTKHPAPAQTKLAAANCITQLDTKNLRCRLLFWPGDRELTAYSGDWTTLDRIDDTDQLGPVKCLAVTQTPKEPRCKVRRPFPCRFIYYTSSDAVEFHNISASCVLVDPVPSQGNSQRIEAKATISLSPGAWRFTDPSNNGFQVLISPRRYSIKIFDASLKLVPSRNSIAELEESHILQISELDVQVKLSFQEKVFENERYLYYKAYHSDHTKRKGQFVFAKVFKWSKSILMDAAMEWERECSALGMLPQSDVIESLLGADARLGLLVFQYKPAASLGRWQQSESAMFMGSMGDVERIQKDMIEALQVLGSVGMRHNDIRPENILYSKENGAKLIGFHHACTPGNEWDTDSSYYEAPEFFEDRKEGRSDILSFGIAMAFFLRVIPLPGSQETPSVLEIKYSRRRRYAGSMEVLTGKKRYDKWLEHVTTNASCKLKEISQWSYIPGMLAPDPDKRISLEELQQLQRDPSPWRPWKDEHDLETGERREGEHVAILD